MVWLGACASPIDVVAVPRASARDAGIDSKVTLDSCLSRDQPAFAAVIDGRLVVDDYALCVCEDLVASTTVEVIGGDVGVNGQLSASAPVQVTGSFAVASTSGIVLGGNAELRVGALECAGPLLGSSAAAVVASDASVAGRVQLEVFEIGGTLAVPSGLAVDVAQGLVASAVRAGDVVVSTPCSCENALSTEVRNLELGGLPVVRDGDQLSNGCAVVQLDVAGASTLHLTVEKSSVVVVPGDLSLDGDFTVSVADNALATLVVLGNVRVGGLLMLGSESGGDVDLIVVGSGTVDLAGGAHVGRLYAPNAELVLHAPLHVIGHALVRRAATSGEFVVSVP